MARQFGISRFPRFRWLDVTGAAGIDDIGVTVRARLVVSDRALEALRAFHIDRCDIEEYDPEHHGA